LKNGGANPTQFGGLPQARHGEIDVIFRHLSLRETTHGCEKRRVGELIQFRDTEGNIACAMRYFENAK
jgi:hypothetical protein